MTTPTILTVSQLTQAIKNLLEVEYRFVRICGEISNLKTPFSGHSYFTLKDPGAQIRVVLFKQQKKFSVLDLKDGQQVVIFGRISVYEPRGEYQLVADTVSLYGIGYLLKEYELLKKKLSDKGYFATEHKKPIPSFPENLIIITSPTGAAIQDFLKIVRNRMSSVHIRILPVKVQGKDASLEIARAIDVAQNFPGTDAIVLCRGGGSIEDLWAFNEEIVAEAIHRSVVPIVTGIGHEIDHTIADFCADCHCPTPTGAAEKIIPDSVQLRRHLKSLTNSLQLRIERRLSFYEQQASHLRKLLGDMKNAFNKVEFRLQLSGSYLTRAMTDFLDQKARKVQSLSDKLSKDIPSIKIDLQEKHIIFLNAQIKNHMLRHVERKQAILSEQITLLDSLSPLATMARGYAIVRRLLNKQSEYRVITRVQDTTAGEELNIVFKEGNIDCIVTKTHAGGIKPPA